MTCFYNPFAGCKMLRNYEKTHYSDNDDKVLFSNVVSYILPRGSHQPTTWQAAHRIQIKVLIAGVS